MSNRSLGLVVLLLGIAVGLALTNPTMQDYVAFLEQKLVLELDRTRQDRAGLVGALLAAQGREIIEATIRPNTMRRNYGLCSLFETRLLGESVLTLGVGGTFIPLRGTEQVAKKVESLGLSPAR